MNSFVAAAIAQMHIAMSPLLALPTRSWALIVFLAVAFWPIAKLTLSLVRWFRDLVRPDGLAHELTVRASDDGYIMLHQWDAPWIARGKENAKLESKKTALLVSCNGRTAHGTVRYSQASYMSDDMLGIPSDVADKLKLSLVPNQTNAVVSVRIAQRFVVENLWNNADPSIKWSFRTAVWVAGITTIISITVPIVLEHLLYR